MKRLPVPYAFDMSDLELQDSLEDALRDRRKIERQAFGNMAYLIAARRHFVHRVTGAPKDKINKNGVSVADRLADAAYITPEGEMHVRASITAMAQDAKIEFSTFDDWLKKFKAYGLIEKIEKGTGNGRPTHITISIRDEHHRQITDLARKEMLKHLQSQSENQSKLIPATLKE